eukprot:5533077-Prymnesium_polylepis.1
MPDGCLHFRVFAGAFDYRDLHPKRPRGWLQTKEPCRQTVGLLMQLDRDKAGAEEDGQRIHREIGRGSRVCVMAFLARR